MTISILLADDHQIFRESLRLLLERHADFEIVGEAADGQETVSLTERLQPQVVVLDLSMPGLDGLEAIQQIKREHPATLVVVLSAHEENQYVTDAFQFGANAYVFKEQSVADLVGAVRAVAAGGQYLSQPLPAPAREAPADSPGVLPRPSFPNDALTLREQQVLTLTAKGYSNLEIGEQLQISARTVETHRAHLMLKLRLRTRLDLMNYAQARRLG